MSEAARRPRRSMLLMPGSSTSKVTKAAGLPCDAIVVDLEDGVAPDAKALARTAVTDLLPTLDLGHRECVVRVNDARSPLLVEDLRAVVAASTMDIVDTVMLPKVADAGDVVFVSRLLELLGAPASLTVIALVETAAGVLNVDEIARAPRVSGLFFGSGDYRLDTGIELTDAALAFPRARIATAAAAARIDAIDAAFFTALRDASATKQDALCAKEFGFTGKVVFHPNQIAPVNEAFTPSAAEVRRAEHIVAEFERQAHLGVVEIDGEFVAVDIMRHYERILATAAAVQGRE